MAGQDEVMADDLERIPETPEEEALANIREAVRRGYIWDPTAESLRKYGEQVPLTEDEIEGARARGESLAAPLPKEETSLMTDFFNLFRSEDDQLEEEGLSFGEQMVDIGRRAIGLEPISAKRRQEKRQARATIERAYGEETPPTDIAGQFASTAIRSGSLGLLDPDERPPRTAGEELAANVGGLAGMVFGAPKEIAEAIGKRTYDIWLKEAVKQTGKRTRHQETRRNLAKRVAKGAAGLGIMFGTASLGEAMKEKHAPEALARLRDEIAHGMFLGAVFSGANAIIPKDTLLSWLGRMAAVTAMIEGGKKATGQPTIDEQELHNQAFEMILNAFFTRKGQPLGRVQAKEEFIGKEDTQTPDFFFGRPRLEGPEGGRTPIEGELAPAETFPAELGRGPESTRIEGEDLMIKWREESKGRRPDYGVEPREYEPPKELPTEARMFVVDTKTGTIRPATPQEEIYYNDAQKVTQAEAPAGTKKRMVTPEELAVSPEGEARAKSRQEIIEDDLQRQALERMGLTPDILAAQAGRAQLGDEFAQVEDIDMTDPAILDLLARAGRTVRAKPRPEKRPSKKKAAEQEAKGRTIKREFDGEDVRVFVNEQGPGKQAGMVHFEVRSKKLSPTGYQSHYAHREAIAEAGGLDPYIDNLLGYLKQEAPKAFKAEKDRQKLKKEYGIEPEEKPLTNKQKKDLKLSKKEKKLGQITREFDGEDVGLSATIKGDTITFKISSKKLYPNGFGMTTAKTKDIDAAGGMDAYTDQMLAELKTKAPAKFKREAELQAKIKAKKTETAKQPLKVQDIDDNSLQEYGFDKLPATLKAPLLNKYSEAIMKLHEMGVPENYIKSDPPPDLPANQHSEFKRLFELTNSIRANIDRYARPKAQAITKFEKEQDLRKLAGLSYRQATPEEQEVLEKQYKARKEKRQKAQVRHQRAFTKRWRTRARKSFVLELGKEFGGISREAALAEFADPADFKRRLGGSNPVFPKDPERGRGFDALAEFWNGKGYVTQEGKKFTKDDAIEIVEKLVRDEEFMPPGKEGEYLDDQARMQREEQQEQEARQLAEKAKEDLPQELTTDSDEALSIIIADAQNRGITDEQLEEAIENATRHSEGETQEYFNNEVSKEIEAALTESKTYRVGREESFPTDLFGEYSETAQAIKDREVERQRKIDKAPPMEEGPGDLFSDRSQQMDIEDITVEHKKPFPDKKLKKSKKIPGAGPGGKQGGAIDPRIFTDAVQAFSNLIKKIDQWEVLQNYRRQTAPLQAADPMSAAEAKNLANQWRIAEDQERQINHKLNRYSKEEHEAMYRALEHPEQREALPEDQRQIVETISADMEMMGPIAVNIGVLPAYRKNYAKHIVADYAEMKYGERIFGRTNFRTTVNTGPRKWDTHEAGEANGVEYIYDMRNMTAARRELRKAIHAKLFVNYVKSQEWNGTDPTISDGHEDTPPNYVTVDHPAFKTWNVTTQRYIDYQGKRYWVKDGKVRINGHDFRVKKGHIEIFDRTPSGEPTSRKYKVRYRDVFTSMDMKVHPEVAPAIKAVVEAKEIPEVVKGVMRLKAASMKVIMWNPLFHNVTVFFKAFPTFKPMHMLMPWLPFVEGYRYNRSQDERDHAMKYGLALYSGGGPANLVEYIKGGYGMGTRGYSIDLYGDPQGADLNLLKRYYPKIYNLIEHLGAIQHQYLLWDRIADLQMGLFHIYWKRHLEKMVKQHKKKTGMDPTEDELMKLMDDAKYQGAEFSNKIVGMMGREEMTDYYRHTLNFGLFSRTYTMSNIRLVKTAFGVMPKNLIGQMNKDTTLTVEEKMKIYRGAAKHLFMVDMVLLFASVAGLGYLFSDLFDIEDKYGNKGGHFPWDNDPGKEWKIPIGTKPDGQVVYMGTPFRAARDIAELFLAFATLTANKMNPTTKAGYEALVAHKDWKGADIYKEGNDWADDIQAFWMHMLKGGTSYETLISTFNPDDQSKLNYLRFLGLQVSHGARGGPMVGRMRKIEKEQYDEKAQAWFDATTKWNESQQQEAIQHLIDSKYLGWEIQQFVLSRTNPKAKFFGSKRRLENLFLRATPEQLDALRDLNTNYNL